MNYPLYQGAFNPKKLALPIPVIFKFRLPLFHGNQPLKIKQWLLGRELFTDGLLVPGPELVEGEGVDGTGFDPCFLAGWAGSASGSADHPGTVTLDERGGAFAGAGFTGSFEGGILKPLVVALVHIMVWLRSPVPRR